MIGSLGNPGKGQYHLAPRAVIEMGTGKLTIQSKKAETKVDGGNVTFGNLEAMILSQGDVYLSGNKVSVEGPNFGNIQPSDGYAKADGPESGAAGIKTSTEVIVTDGARVKGGTISNVQVNDASKKTATAPAPASSVPRRLPFPMVLSSRGMANGPTKRAH